MVRARNLLVCFLTAGLLLTGSCSSRPQLATLEGDSEESKHEQNIAVEVVSRMFMDCAVYLQVGASGRRRLGKATGMSTTTLGVVWSADTANASEAVLIAEPVGSDRKLTSSAFRLAKGSRVVWTIQGHQYASPSEVNLQLF